MAFLAGVKMFSFLTRLLWDESFELSHRILNVVLFSFAIFASIASIANYFTKEPLIVQVFAIIFVIYFSITFYIARVKKRWKFIAHLTIWVSFFGISFFYILDGGLFCGNGYFFLMEIAVIISIFKGKQRIFYISVAVILLLCLLTIEFSYPRLFHHLTREQCATNIFLSFIMATFFSIFLLVLFASQLEKQKNAIEVLSKQDYLTGLLNRRGIFEKLEILLTSLKEKDFTFSIILSDIDNFKKINDNFGHITGDVVLKEVAKLIALSLRTEDILGRWGGEEFIIILPHANLQSAIEVAERIKEKLTSNPIKYQNMLINISATFGVGEYKKELSLNKNLTLIDNALYKGKSEGKNRVIASN